MSVPIKSNGSSLEIGAPTRLFESRLIGSNSRDYDVSADGRFLMNVVPANRLAVPITVVLNWAAPLSKQ